MNEDATLVGLAQTTARVLTIYIGVHDNILGVPWYRSLRRVIPIPLIFDRIPYSEHRETLRHLLGELRAVRDRAHALSGVLLKSGDTRFCSSLEQYCDALLDSIVCLQQICYGLAEKAKGRTGLRWAEYRRRLKDYEASCKHYMRLDKILNLDFEGLKRNV